MPTYQYLPYHIDPIAFSLGSFSLRWYSLAYIIGFCVVYGLLSWRIRKGEISSIAKISKSKFLIPKQNQDPKDEILNKETQDAKYEMRNTLQEVLLFSAVGALIGGRLGYVFFYNPSYFWAHPWAIVSPFGQGGQLVGIFGMSFYGGVAGALVAAYLLAFFRKLNFWAWVDFVAPAIGAGYFFGRLGNFLNGELYGRVTGQVWGMYFPADSSGLLRHPSQLYEALGEGLLLFALFWTLRNRKLSQGGFLLGYVGAYAAVRFGLEFFREPDAQTLLVAHTLSFNQVLSLIVGLAAVVVFKKRLF